MSPDAVFHKFLNSAPAPDPKEKRRSCWSRLRHSGSVATFGIDSSGTLKTGLLVSSFQ